MKKRKYIWQKAFSLSFAFHLVVIITVGAMLAGFHEEIQRPKEQFITVNLADTPEEIAKANEKASPFSKLKNLLDSPAQNNDSNNSQSEEKQNSESKPFQNEPTNPSNSSVGELSSPDGVLPPSNSGGNSSNTSASDNEGGNGGSVGSGGGGSTSGGSENGSGDSGASQESLANIAARFSSAVNSNKQYPYAAKRLGQQGTVGVYVALDASGNLISSQITSSAGNNLDNAALNAVRNSCPFPHGYGSTVEININVNFYLN